MAHSTSNPKCTRYFHNACSEAMGAWLPTLGYPGTWWERGLAAHITRRDGFLYEGERPTAAQFLGYQGPKDGTFFVYGNAGPPKGHAVYDPVHRIAFYQQGCCSWNDVVAATNVTAPPKPVVKRDLHDLVTVRGIRLGQTMPEVMRIYGKSTPIPISAHLDVHVLPYTTWRPIQTLHSIDSCGQFQNFFFRKNRLIMIQLGNGC
ncbi:MAG: hypothetical protein M3R51_07045 [Candidatus Eremiobacteraeota bacterium]|nr:hypothetical protein [Candidatus Eremiobacteraeota bacterium]